MPEIIVQSMAGHPEWIEPCAAWWHRQWGEGMGYSLDGARAAIESLTKPEGRQEALMALVDGVPAASVFLVDSDLESHAHLAPWLAGLLVLPEFRRVGVGERLVAATVARGTTLGYESLYLYTSTRDFYRRRGWTTYEEIVLHDVPHEIMMYTL